MTDLDLDLDPSIRTLGIPCEGVRNLLDFPPSRLYRRPFNLWIEMNIALPVAFNSWIRR